MRRRRYRAAPGPSHLRPRTHPSGLKSALEEVVETCPGYNLGKAYKRVTRDFERAFRDSNLTLAQFALLVHIGLAEPAQASQVAAGLGSDLSTISRSIDLVTERGLVSQERGSDRRVRVYRLTDAGRAALSEAIPKWRHAREYTLARVDRRWWQETLRQLRALASG